MSMVKILREAEGCLEDLRDFDSLDVNGLKPHATWVEHPDATVARLRHGTHSGASVVMLRFDDPATGKTFLTQMTMANFLNAAACMKAFEEADAALMMPPAGKVQ